LEIKTKGFQGNVHKTARVSTSDPKRPQITIGLKGKIWTAIQMKPRYAHLKGVLGDPMETVVSLQADKEEPLEIAVVSVSIPEKITVELIEVEKGRSYQVKIKNKVDQQTTYNGLVKLSTNYPEKPELLIRVTGNVRPLLEVRPKVMNLGRMSQSRVDQLGKDAKPFRRPATVILNKGDNLQIEKLELEKSLFTVISKKLRVGRMVQILVEPNFEKLQKGKNEDLLRVYTNQKGHDVVEIPLTFEIVQ
jgi:hypothetical protein